MSGATWRAPIVLLLAVMVALGAASPASARSKKCRSDVQVSYATLTVANRVAGVQPSCSDAVGIAFHAMDRGYPRFLSFYWRGRVLSMGRTFLYRRDYVTAVYANRTQRVTFISFRRFNDPCVVLNVTC
jgi:hypothetical protein